MIYLFDDSLVVGAFHGGGLRGRLALVPRGLRVEVVEDFIVGEDG